MLKYYTAKGPLTVQVYKLDHNLYHAKAIFINYKLGVKSSASGAGRTKKEALYDALLNLVERLSN